MTRCAHNAIAAPNGAGSAAPRLRVVTVPTGGFAMTTGAPATASGGTQPSRRPRLE